MADIILTPELLEAQSSEMASLQSDYEALFTKVTTALNGVNESWSENLASNFSGKISSAQKSFASIANMLTNGSAGAHLAGLTFQAGTGLNLGEKLDSILGHLMGGNLAEQLGAGGIKSLFNSTELAQWVQEHAKELSAGGAQVISELTGMGVSDIEAITTIAQQMSQGDIEGALRTMVNEGADIIGSSYSGGLPDGSWVAQLEEATGGTLKLASLESGYYSNLLSGIGNNVIDLGVDVVTGNVNFGNEAKILGEMFWNVSAGPVIETAGDAAYSVVSNIPVLGDYYKAEGANDFTGALGVMMGDVVEMATGNSEDAAYVQNYYTDHGGIAKGIVDGIVDIGDYVYHNIFGAK